VVSGWVVGVVGCVEVQFGGCEFVVVVDLLAEVVWFGVDFGIDLEVYYGCFDVFVVVGEFEL